MNHSVKHTLKICTYKSEVDEGQPVVFPVACVSMTVETSTRYSLSSCR